MRWARLAVTMLCAACAVGPGDRAPAGRAGAGRPIAVVRVSGSDTLVNLVQAWAEHYRGVRPDVMVEVSGGGSGVGIASLTNGLVDIAAASRTMTREERQRLQRDGRPPAETAVGLDALAVYVHRDNPLVTLSIDRLADIFGEGGTTSRWSQLDVAVPGCASDRIVRIGRQNSSGTYAYFREAVLGPRRDYALGIVDQSGSRDVVALITRTPCAIGYSGLAYLSPGVRAVALAWHDDRPAVMPSASGATDGTYPLARRLYFYTGGVPGPATMAFVGWVRSPAGQRVTSALGFVPLCEVDP